MLMVERASGRCLRAGLTWAAGLGYAPRDLTGRLVLELVHVDDRCRYEEALRQTDSDGIAVSLDVRVQGSGGLPVRQAWTVMPARHPDRLRIVVRDGSPRRVTGGGGGREEITTPPTAGTGPDRLVTHSQSLLSILDFDGRITCVNAAWSRLGYTASDLVGTCLHDYVHAEERETVRKWLECLIRDGATASITSRCRDKAGNLRWIVWSIGTFAGQQCLYSSGNDITETKQAEQRLFESYANIERLLASISLIVIGLDAHGRVTRWNSVAESTFGLAADAVIGGPFVDCGIVWSDRHPVAQLVHAPELPARFPHLGFRRHERDRFVSLTVNEVEGPDRAIKEFVVLGSDVTDHEIREEQLRRAQKLEGIGQLAAGLAHEITTPIQYIGGNLQFLADASSSTAGLFAAIGRLRGQIEGGCSPEDLMPEINQMCLDAQRADVDFLQVEVPKAISQSLEGVDRVARTIKAMQEFSALNAGDSTTADLNSSVDTTLVIANNELKYVANIETSLAPGLPPVRCGANEINQVLLILLVNAAQAIGPRRRRGRVSVSTHRDGDWAELRVSDTGAGINEAARPHVFEPFFTTRPGHGSGRGLSIAHGIIVKKYGGRIWFDTESGGTTFFVRLPIATSATAVVV
jgi:PAS domain S-box-containing protein